MRDGQHFEDDMRSQSGMRTQERPQPRTRDTGPRRSSGRTRDELYEEAKALGIPGRSAMSKQELEAAVDRRRGRR